MTEKVPMTQAGAEQLRQELEQLKRVKRPEVIQAISEARKHGDLKENAEYHAAKEQQSEIEGRILKLEGDLSHAHIIDVTQITNEGKVIFGATVTLINCDTDETVRYCIVGEHETDVKQGKISFKSPIARALIGKQEGDEVEVTTPAGITAYDIDKVEYI